MVKFKNTADMMRHKKHIFHSQQVLGALTLKSNSINAPIAYSRKDKAVSELIVCCWMY